MRLTGRVTNLERSVAVTQDRQPGGAVVIYDRQSGVPLPANEPAGRAGVRIWIPDNRRAAPEAGRAER
jgi:hypothetical protein